MQTIRRSAERGYANHGWLKSHHSFSFGGYVDPKPMVVGNLRVINEDRIAAGAGFGTHGHANMEIISLVMQGALGHRDSMGNSSLILPGEIQRMSAGTGVEHSEMNRSIDGETHFFQIWIEPRQKDVRPAYQQVQLDLAKAQGQLMAIAVPSVSQANGAVFMHADATLYLGYFEPGQSAQWVMPAGRQAYVHLMAGQARVNGQLLDAGDAIAVQAEPGIFIDQGSQAQVLLFDLAMK